jgi:serine/threonine protein kinase
MVNLVNETIIDRRYRLEELLGEGGSGSTYRATRLSDSATVAIKILSLQHLNDWKQLELFEREAQILAQLDHPQIPKYLEYFHVDSEQDRAFCIVQQLAPGQPLNALVQSGWRGTPAEVSSIAQQILEILQYLQSQSPPLIHRDIKPHNIVRNEDGRVFLVDFGAVQATYHNTLMKGNTVAGTYGYMAPEQFRGRASIASDLYGLGATVLYLLTHRSPADLPQERLKISFRSHVRVSENFGDWLETMLEPDEADRFPSATKALKALTSKRYRRANQVQKTGFPWRGAAAALVVGSIVFPIAHRYRYAFLTVLGMHPTDLCTSIKLGDSKALNDYLNHGGSVDTFVRLDDRTDGDGEYNGNEGPLLHCAVSAGQVNITKELLRRGATDQAVDTAGQTVVHRIVNQYYECSDTVKGCPPDKDLALLQLFAASKDSINNSKSNDLKTPLYLAVEQCKPTLVKELIRLGADPNVTSSEGDNLLHALSSSNGFNHSSLEKQWTKDVFNILISQGINPNAVNHNGDRPLHKALFNSQHQVTDLLIANNAKLDIANKNGRTPLMVAIAQGNSQGVMKLLARKGINVNAQDKDGLTASHLLMRSNAWKPLLDKSGKSQIETEWLNKAQIAQQLFAAGANPNLVDKKGWTPLHLLAQAEANRVEGYQTNLCLIDAFQFNPLFELAVKNGANPRAASSNGYSALHLVAKHPRLVKQLVALGWDPLQKNHRGSNALTLMVENHYLTQEQSKLLETAVRGGDLNVRDAQGNTAIHRFLEPKADLYPKYFNKLEKIVSILVTLGARVDIQNQAGKTPLDLARQTTNPSDAGAAQHIKAYLNQCQLEFPNR